MPILNHSAIEKLALPGIVHQTVAGPRDGLKHMEVWLQTMAPGAVTPVHRHDCEEVVVVLEGSGILELEGKKEPFGPGSTLIVPPNAVHQISNTGEGAIRLLAALATAPVTVETADGARMLLPWDQHHLAGA